jgi:protein TonB
MTKPISILFLASAALHAAVLGLINFEQPELIQAGAPFSVSIQASSSAINGQQPELEKAPDRSTTTEHAVIETTSKMVVPNEQAVQAQKGTTQALRPSDNIVAEKKAAVVVKTTPQADIKTAAVTTNNPVASASEQSLALKAKAASLLRVDLEQAFALHFRYPRLAIKHGWQGEVRLGLRIEASGQLSRIRVLQGSGYALLDKAAMKSLKEVKVLPAATALLDDNGMDLILPVQYRLL